jgi:hypothetical protein
MATDILISKIFYQWDGEGRVFLSSDSEKPKDISLHDELYIVNLYNGRSVRSYNQTIKAYIPAIDITAILDPDVDNLLEIHLKNNIYPYYATVDKLYIIQCEGEGEVLCKKCLVCTPISEPYIQEAGRDQSVTLAETEIDWDGQGEVYLQESCTSPYLRVWDALVVTTEWGSLRQRYDGQRLNAYRIDSILLGGTTNQLKVEAVSYWGDFVGAEDIIVCATNPARKPEPPDYPPLIPPVDSPNYPPSGTECNPGYTRRVEDSYWTQILSAPPGDWRNGTIIGRGIDALGTQSMQLTISGNGGYFEITCFGITQSDEIPSEGGEIHFSWNNPGYQCDLPFSIYTQNNKVPFRDYSDLYHRVDVTKIVFEGQ